MAGLFDSWNRGVQVGRENRRQRVLGQNLQGALGGDQAALSNVFGVDPDAGLRVQQFAAQQQKAQQDSRQAEIEEFGKVAGAFASTKNPQLYSRFVMLGSKLGFVPPGAPQQPSPEDLEESAQAAMALAQAYGGAKDNTPSSIRELQMLQANPALAKLDMERRTAARPQLIQTADGYAYATPQGATPLNYSGAPQGGDQQQVQRALAMLAGQPGVTMTSGTRTPQRNAAVGGVPNSQHLQGTAGDYAVPPAQKAAFMAQARAQGFEAIDEGDHVHLELPRAGQRVMPAPKQTAQSELERRLALAQQMGATQEEQKRMVVGGGAARDAQRISSSDATKARQKLIQIQTARRQLQAAKQAFGKLQNSYSAGPGGQFIPTQEGQAFDRAVRNLSPLITAVTRVPGVGAMSDYESKLQEAALPSRGTFEGTTQQQIADLEAMLDTIESGYRDLLGETPQAQREAPATQQSGGWSIKVKP